MADWTELFDCPALFGTIPLTGKRRRSNRNTFGSFRAYRMLNAEVGRSTNVPNWLHDGRLFKTLQIISRLGSSLESGPWGHSKQNVSTV